MPPTALPPGTAYVRLSDPPVHSGMMAAPIMVDQPGSSAARLGALCLARSEPAHSIGEFDRLVMQFYADHAGSLCAIGHVLYGRNLPIAEFLAAGKGGANAKG